MRIGSRKARQADPRPPLLLKVVVRDRTLQPPVLPPPLHRPPPHQRLAVPVLHDVSGGGAGEEDTEEPLEDPLEHPAPPQGNNSGVMLGMTTSSLPSLTSCR